MIAPFHRSIRLTRVFWVAFVIFIITMLHGAYYTYLLLPRVYLADAEIKVTPRGSDSLLKSEIEIMRSSDFLLPIINNLGLDKTWAKRLYRTKLDVVPPQDALSFMSRILRIDTRPGTNIIDISVASEVPKEASDIANEIVDQYVFKRENDDETHPVQIICRAELPENPSMPYNALNLAISMYWGIGLGLGLAVILEYVFWYVSSQVAISRNVTRSHRPSDEY